MATRLIGTDTADPRLPQGVIDASQGTASTDLAAGDTLAEAQAYCDAQVALLEATIATLAARVAVLEAG